jgi:hypothetical protein
VSIEKGTKWLGLIDIAKQISANEFLCSIRLNFIRVPARPCLKVRNRGWMWSVPPATAGVTDHIQGRLLTFEGKAYLQ